MAGEKLFGALMDDINKLLHAVEANAEALNHLESRKTELTALRDQLVVLSNQQKQLEAQRQAISEEIRAKSEAAKAQMRALRNGAKAVYGDRTQKIEEFGVKVRG
jgi:predicted  nucleic acid-binding Zn-ribbon protein